MHLFQHLFNSREKYTFIENQQPKQIDFREPGEIIVVVVLLFYVHGKHLRSCWDGQLT